MTWNHFRGKRTEQCCVKGRLIEISGLPDPAERVLQSTGREVGRQFTLRGTDLLIRSVHSKFLNKLYLIFSPLSSVLECLWTEMHGIVKCSLLRKFGFCPQLSILYIVSDLHYLNY